MAVLTDATIRALPAPASGQKIYRLGGVPGLCCRVSQGGTKTFVLVIGKEGRKITIGRYGVITLADARTEAKKKLAEHTLGKLSPKSAAYPEAVELFLADKAKERRAATVKDYRRRLYRLGFRGSVADITHDEAARKLEKLKAPSERSHTLVASKVFFNWCMKRRLRSDNPFFGLSKPKHVPRKRVLSDDELKRIWQATSELSVPDRIVRLLIATGQRLGEVERWEPAMLAGNLLTVPETVTKNSVEQLLPVGPLALELLSAFPGRYGSWGKYKADLDEKTGINEAWMIRDIRRTFRTNLSKLGVAPHVAERLLHHITFAGSLQLTYDRHAYLAEMREAVERWEAQLSGVCC